MARVGYTVECQRAKFKHWHLIGTHKETDIEFRRALRDGSVQWQVGKDDYGEFTEKFKAKLTTDDCYTPVEVYEAVLGWLREKVDLSGANIVRPFWPGDAFNEKEEDE